MVTKSWTRWEQLNKIIDLGQSEKKIRYIGKCKIQWDQDVRLEVKLRK